MIALQELNKALCDKVKISLSEKGLKIPLIAEDLSKPIIRPSIKIEIEDGLSERNSSRLKRTEITVRIYFFAKDKDRPKQENITVREVLSNAFLEEVKVNNFWIPILDTVEFTVTDGVLIATFELEYFERLPEGNGNKYESNELMEQLHYKQELEG